MAQIRMNAPGDDFDIIRTITLIPSGDSIAKAWLTVKRHEADTDAAALFQLAITTASTASGQITDTGAGDLIGAVTFKISPTNSRLVGSTPRHYDIQIKSANGKIFTAESGDIAAGVAEVTVVDV